MLVVEASHVAVAVNYRHILCGKTNVGGTGMRVAGALRRSSKQLSVHLRDRRSPNEYAAATRHLIGIFCQSCGRGISIASRPRGSMCVKNRLDRCPVSRLRGGVLESHKLNEIATTSADNYTFEHEHPRSQLEARAYEMEDSLPATPSHDRN